MQLANVYPHLYHFVSNVTAEDLPDSFDLRAEGHMFTIRSQLHCAACYVSPPTLFRTQGNPQTPIS